MRLIIGGAYQGKRAYAMEAYGIREEEMLDGAETEPELPELVGTGFRFKCIYNFHMFIKRLLEDGGEPLAITEKLIVGNPELIVIMDEVGNGIIPLEKSDRIWREQAGVISCFLAARAESVERIVCGLSMRIK